MKKISILLALVTATTAALSQKIVNLVLVGEKGVTKNVREAHSFVVIKKYPDGFQRLDYKMKAPLQRVRTYSDSTLAILKGSCYEYSPAGRIVKSGYYQDNQKAGDWYYYNDTGKVILEEKYEAGVLLKTIDPDTLKKEAAPVNLNEADEREAVYKGGNSDWSRYLSRELNADVGSRSVNGGRVITRFRISTSGKITDVHLEKSVEFVLDEEAIRVIENSPPWQPALQRGKAVNAYRRQPLTFIK
ncbi:MAG TPA: TonB family protein [Ferruginibacter sp.]|nr:hypothetical protein [Chitinophagaceae bacterium]HRI23472.1 TonB family protein [Ferruginibacter sp.]